MERWVNEGEVMSVRKLITHGVLALIVVSVVIAILRWYAPMPQLKDGDLIFQTSLSGQSNAIMLATHSAYSHTGIVKKTAKGWVVIEAVGPVKETPLKIWVNRGWRHRIAVYRYPGLTEMQAQAVFLAAKKLYGRRYDLYFSFDNDSVYCSELTYEAYHGAGISLGKVQTIGQLGTDLGFAKSLLNRRILSDPECKLKGLSGANCLSLVRQRLLITPKSLANDPKLKPVFSNYPWRS